MPVLDLRELPADHTLQADICIIGSGPAGSTLARELTGCNFRIVVLESGGRTRQPEADELNEIESIGAPRVMDQWLVRNRMLGGSSNTWTGRCAPFDAIDYAKRDWVPYSGWPFGAADMLNYLDRSASYLGIGHGSGFTDENFWTLSQRSRATPDVRSDLLAPFFWQFSKDAVNPFDYMRFGRILARSIKDDVKVFLNATVTNIVANESASAVQSVIVKDRDSVSRTVESRTVVLCAGGIENARLLLASRDQMACGLGNQNDVVGRFLMDHPRGRIGEFALDGSEALQRQLGVYNVRSPRGRHRFRHGLRLSPQYQKQNDLLNCAVWLNEVVTPDDPWNALSRMLRARGSFVKDAIRVGANYQMIARGLRQFLLEGNGLPRKLERLELTCIVEQRPDPESRVTLSDRTDRLGMPLSCVDWKINEQEELTVRSIAYLVRDEFKRVGLNDLTLDEWVERGEKFSPYFCDIAHPTGTTRISENPKTGVVDADCQVHGVGGLYVAGSSVFPTSGHANPTQMIVAMSVRLADTIKRQFLDRSA